MSDLPLWASEAFRREGGCVRWVTETEHLEAVARLAKSMPRRDAARFRNKLIPFGEPAGARPVHGHGRLVTITSKAFTTADVAAMLDDGGRWPWQDGAPPVRGVASDLDGARLASVLACVEMHGGDLVWRVSPHSTIPAGARVAGAELTGARRVMMRGGVGFLFADLAHALTFGDWPWRTDMRGTHGDHVLTACDWG